MTDHYPIPKCYQRAALAENRRYAMRILAVCLLTGLILIPISRGIRTAMTSAEVARESSR